MGLELSMAKSKFIKTKIAAFASTLMLTAAEVSALGLGAINVQSNLDQPLKAVIELRVNPGDDVSSVKASIASKSDFESNGISYQSYVENMNITLDRSSGGARLRVDSSNVVIKEPFVSFLVRVDWSGGSFLREYTALIDPPAYAQGSSSSISTPNTFTSPRSVSQQPTFSNPSSSTRTFTDSSPFVNTGSSRATDGRYGPVRAGETLSLIAQDLSNQYPDLGIYQIMKALFEQNPSAFIKGNINGLIKGATLEIGDINAIRSIDKRVAKEFFSQQAADWSGASSSIKVGQDQYNDSENIGSDSSSGSDIESFQIGESSDTDSLISDSDSDTGNGEAIVLKQQVSELESSLASSSQENQALKERVSILEAQLADMRDLVSLGDVENANLANLEKSLADANNAADSASDLIGDSADLIGDAGSDLVDAGSDLIGEGTDLIGDGADLIGDAGSDLIGEANDLIGDDADLIGDAGSDLIGEDSDGLIDEGADLIGDASGDLLGEDSDGLIDDGSDLIGIDTDVNEPNPSIVEPVDTAQKAPPVNRQPEVGLVDKVKSAVIDGGLWKPIGGIGLALLGLIAFIIRRRRADEEFEISMLSIESNSQSINTVEDPSLSQVSESSVTASVSHVEESAASVADSVSVAADEKETSFLTVYSDSDAVVQADEVDPIAEADVYIAYGRHEQAEEVLLDGISNYPERTDIKHKLLTVYHKNENAEGFGRVAEELYSNRETLNPEMWGEICTMGKEVDSANPIYDLSVDDIATADAAVAEASEAVDTDEDVAAIDDDSIQLINFEEGQSEIGSLDNVEIDALDIDKATELDEISVELESDEVDIGDDIELTIQLDEEEAVDIEANSVVEVMADIDMTVDESDEDEEFDVAELQEVSDLEIDADYDEQRTQYELAKVFADLGDEDGARKILTDIIADETADESLINEAKELLDTIS